MQGLTEMHKNLLILCMFIQRDCQDTYYMHYESVGKSFLCIFPSLQPNTSGISVARYSPDASNQIGLKN